MGGHDVGHGAFGAAPTRGRLRRCAQAIPLLAVLALGLALAGCDRCGDFFWQRQPGSCHVHPDQN